MEKKKILLGMSGGIDSTYSVVALREAGYEVYGAFLKMGEDSDVASAERAAEALRVPLTVVDCSTRFQEIVIGDFLKEYSAARTPNPCVICNRYVKIEMLCQTAKQMGIEHVATGHYTNIGFDEATDRYFIKKARDARKDQSYVLWRLTQEQLSMLTFPLSEMDKSEIKVHAKELALPNADAPESQEICFIPSNDYVSYIEERIGKFPKGSFIDENGKKIGTHEGIIHYTIGQRKGLGLSLGKPAFVTAIDPEHNTVTVTGEEKVFTDRLVCHTLNFMAMAPVEEGEVMAEGKIRYAARPERARVLIKGDLAEVFFEHPVRAVTPGQSVVFYDGDRILFGGIIDRS
jgi:tRNA-specific 2-thiouridylase